MKTIKLMIAVFVFCFGFVEFVQASHPDLNLNVVANHIDGKDGYDVYPTGGPATDQANIQAAVNAAALSSTVILKAGAFDLTGFGSILGFPPPLGVDPAVGITKGLTVRGELDSNGNHLTKINGGSFCLIFEADEGQDGSIKDLWFDSNTHGACGALSGGNFEFRNLKLTNQLRPSFLFFGKFGVGIFTNGAPAPTSGKKTNPRRITGTVTVEGNLFEAPINDAGGHDYALNIFNVASVIRNNHISGTRVGIGANTENATQSLHIEDNVLAATVRWDSASGSVTNNTITLLPGSGRHGLKLQGGAESLLVRKNLINMTPGSRNSIECCASNAVIRNNHINGEARFGLVFKRGASNNVMVGNNLATLNATNFLVFLDSTTSNNTLVGFSGCHQGAVNDDGTNNTLVGCQPMQGGVGPEVSDAVHRDFFESAEAPE